MAQSSKSRQILLIFIRRSFFFFFFSYYFFISFPIFSLVDRKKRKLGCINREAFCPHGGRANAIHYGSITLSTAVNILKHQVAVSASGRGGQTPDIDLQFR